MSARRQIVTITSNMLFRIFAACVIAVVAALPSAAQPPARFARTVVMGHIGINSADPDAATAFWTDLMGASSYSRDSFKGVSLLGLMIVFDRAAPSGPSAGSTIDHLGFRVPDLQPYTEKLAKTSYKSSQPTADRLLIDGPDGVRIELMEDSSEYAGMEFDHIHFYSTQPKRCRPGT